METFIYKHAIDTNKKNTCECNIVSFIYRNQHANIDFNKKKRTIQRLKRGVLPKNPTTVAEILAAFEDPAIFDTHGKTLHENENFPFYSGAIETDKFSYCVFSSPKTVQLVEQHIPIAKRDILMDATFRIVPVGPFKQLLIFYIRSYKKVFAYSVFNLHCSYCFYIRLWHHAIFSFCI